MGVVKFIPQAAALNERAFGLEAGAVLVEEGESSAPEGREVIGGRGWEERKTLTPALSRQTGRGCRWRFKSAGGALGIGLLQRCQPRVQFLPS